jgi:small subunit ribosomal protein S20
MLGHSRGKEMRMPIIKSAKKRMRQDQKRRERNRSTQRRTKTISRKLSQLIHEKKTEEVKKKLPELIAVIDKAASKGIWHKNKAARQKSKLIKRLTK